jgi:serine/threonine-protein kinase HipA
MKSLIVKYNDYSIGTLFQDESGRMLFQYSPQWLADGFAISISLPLQAEIFPEQKCRPFFEGLLPEGVIRDEIARNLGVSSKSDFVLLREIGGDCAGAINVGSGSAKNEPSDGYLEHLEGKKLLEALRPLNGKPLFAGESDVRLSIAGSQRKLPVIYENGKIFVPHGNIPTTFIIKPEISGIDSTIYNELYCLALAQKVGLSVPACEILRLESEADKKYLLIKRYDRKKENDKIIRLHQEDLCQAIGVPSENKYQKDGGPSFKDLFSIIRNYSYQPVLDIRNAIRIAIFNYIIGNADAHGKNFSFLFEKNSIKLAPFYDLLSTEIYPSLSTKMAMKIGGKYNPDDVFRRHWHEFANENSINQKQIDKEIEYVSNAVSEYCEPVAQQLFGSDRCRAIVNILELTQRKLKLLERK